MKAAVIHKIGDIPQYQDFPDPAANQSGVLVDVKAIVLENFDKGMVAGIHKASRMLYPIFPAIVGKSGGIGTLQDGTLVSFSEVKPPYGAMAEKAIAMEYDPVPEGIAAASAAAIPSSALTSLLPLKYGVKLQPGETVLINGATGVSGKIALQIAKLLGARRVVGAGRNDESLREAMRLGADAVIDLKQSDEAIAAAFAQETKNGYDIVLDFLWGHPTELLLDALIPKEIGFARHTTRFVQIGQMAGPTISLSAEMVITSGLVLTGAGASIPPEAMPEAVKQIWDWMKEDKLHMDIEEVPLKSVAEAWERKTEGKRIVLIP